tara:strand:+ start:10488 stop:10844 length:357 start_codon:yes stop_codon:yes gene_type:complete
MKTFNESTYRPLPKEVTILNSLIDGLGLHATSYLNAGTVLGETHVLVHNRDRHEWVRTPLGGFINHSDDPNSYIATDKGDRILHVIRPVKAGEEITVFYRFKGYDGTVGDDTEPEIEE